MSSYHHVYCIGLGGVGVSAVAKLLLAEGAQVSGSDPASSPLIDDVVARGAMHYRLADGVHITSDIDLVVATDDAPADHPERVAAAARGITCENFSVTIGRLMLQSAQRITVGGTNGKSTTTAMTGLLLTAAGCDPRVVVGSRVREFDGNVRLGEGKLFVVEADEYRDHFLNYHPTVAVVTNIEADHLDYFGTVKHMEESFQKYTALVPTEGVLVINADDVRTKELRAGGAQVVRFGFSAEADLQAVNYAHQPGAQTWETLWRGASLGEFRLHIPGQFNVMNALGAMAAALAIGTDPRTFASTLEQFRGIWRRFQILNPSSLTTIVSDYAHHPTAVQATLEGAKNFYPDRNLVAVFQPHHRSRLTALFDDFVRCFSDADNVVIVETYSVPGRDVPESESKNGRQLVTALQAQGVSATYVASPAEAETLLKTQLQPGDVAVVMGAGDIWRSAESLALHYV